MESARWLILAAVVATSSICHAESKQPIAHWVFDRAGVRDRSVRDLAGHHDATITGSVKLIDRPVQALLLDGSTTSVEVKQIDAAQLPQEHVSAEAWVCLNRGTRWGGIVGYIQDNGTYEKGWLLGYSDSHFNFSVSTDSKLPYLSGNTKFLPETWYHVAGTYDGAQVKIYVNGQLENSTPLSGPIAYPPEATFQIGAYRDKDEFYRGDGLVHEVCVYDRALSEAEVLARYQAKSRQFPRTLDPALGPYLQFATQSTAHVFWETGHPCPSVVEFGSTQSLGQRVEQLEAKTVHRVTLTGLEPNKVYHYCIRHADGEGKAVSKVYRFDTALNYSLPDWPDRPNPYAGSAHDDAKTAQRIIAETGITKGHCLLFGCRDGRLAYELARQTELRITCVDTDQGRLSQIAERMMQAGIYGWRVSVRRVASWDKLPFTKYFANLIVSESVSTTGQVPVDPAEMYRVLRPGGGAACLGPFRDTGGKLARNAMAPWLQTLPIRPTVTEDAAGLWAKIVRPPLDGIGHWTHQYGRPDNSADSGDQLQGASQTDHLQVQWLGRPGADFGADRNPRMPAPLSVSGRLFHQGLDRMVALDAYNGTILWSLEIPGLLRVNMPRDASAWCADQHNLYVAVRDTCWRLDPQTGARSATYPVLNAADGQQKPQWGYVAATRGKLYGSAVKQGAAYTNIWGRSSEGWYDGTGGPTTFKVCSDLLFALDSKSGDTIWTYENAPVINTTIAIGGGRVYFVECRHPKVTGYDSGRIGLPELWNDQYLVALDTDSGEKLWEQSIDTADGIVVFYLSYGDDRLFIASSAAGKYNLFAFDAKNGSPLWNANHPWTADNHGGHMQHPVVLRDKVYFEPCVYDAEDGTRLTDKMGRHAGCATYVGTAGALIHRGAGGRVAMWDIDSGKSTFWDSLRPSCWLSTMAAGGMVLSPEGGGGCSCANWLQTSLGFVKADTVDRAGESTNE
jgi:outer membrane protein assembly factor BamB/SAM-dependent methyltransferase